MVRSGAPLDSTGTISKVIADGRSHKARRAALLVLPDEIIQKSGAVAQLETNATNNDASNVNVGSVDGIAWVAWWRACIGSSSSTCSMAGGIHAAQNQEARFVFIISTG